MEDKEKKKSNRKGIIIAFIVILLGINAVQLFLGLNKSKIIEEKDKTIAEKQHTIDSTKTELNKVITELETKKAEIAKLGGDTTRLGEQIRAIIVERDKYLSESKRNYSKFMAIKKEIDNAKSLVKESEDEITRLKAQVDTLYRMNSNLKSTIALREDSINKVMASRNELQEKVEMASILRAENVAVKAINPKGKEKEGDEFKAKAIDKLKITFRFGDNKVAAKETKQVLLRVIEPDGAALFDLATGGGSFTNEDNKEVFYTLKQDVLFDNSGQGVSFDYKKGSAYKPGRHTIEIYSDDYLIGQTTFTVK